MTYLLGFLLSRLKQLIMKKPLTTESRVVPFIMENYNEHNRCYLNPWNATVKNLWKLLILWRLACFLFFRVSKPKRAPSPAALSSLGWSSLRTSSACTLCVLSRQTCSHSGLCQSCELLGPRLCPRSCGCLGWRYSGQQFHRLCYSGR